MSHGTAVCFNYVLTLAEEWLTKKITFMTSDQIDEILLDSCIEWNQIATNGERCAMKCTHHNIPSVSLTNGTCISTLYSSDQYILTVGNAGSFTITRTDSIYSYSH